MSPTFTEFIEKASITAPELLEALKNTTVDVTKVGTIISSIYCTLFVIMILYLHEAESYPKKNKKNK